MKRALTIAAFLVLWAAPAYSQSQPLTPIVSGPASSGVVFKAGPGNFVSAYAVCTAACSLMIFNSTTIPADGATTPGTLPGNLVSCIPIGAGGLGSVSYAPGPFVRLDTGITAAISSAVGCTTLTKATTAFIHGLVQ